MRVVTSFFVLLIFLLVGAAVGGLFLPATTQVERSVILNSDQATVFDYVNNLQNFRQWSPWSRKDPDMAVNDDGSEEGIGASMQWSSEEPEIASGRMSITSSVPFEHVKAELDFGAMGTAESYFDLMPEDAGTRLVWGLQKDHGMNVFSRYVGLLMDRWIGPDYEEGLQNLKQLVDALPRIYSREIKYTIEDTEFTGYVAYPRGAQNLPGVLVVHEWWGHNDYVRKRADMLAELGYAAFAIDMYGDGKVAEHPKQATEFMTEVASQQVVALQRFNTALSLLKELPVTDPEKTAAIGYCFGGAVVLSMARMGVDLDGVVSFHGALQNLPPIGESVSAQFLVLNGADDPMVPPEQKDQFQAEMKAAGLKHEFIDYPGVTHAFTNPDATEKGKEFNLPLRYDANADTDSWRRMTEFLKRLYGNS